MRTEPRNMKMLTTLLGVSMGFVLGVIVMALIVAGFRADSEVSPAGIALRVLSAGASPKEDAP